MKTITLNICLSSALAIALVSCKKKVEDTPPPAISAPSTYSFDNVDFGGQTLRMNMLDEILGDISASHAGATIDSSSINNKFNGSGFTEASYNGTGKSLASKASVLFKGKIIAFLNDAAIKSKLTTDASNGVAGRIKSAKRTILVNDKGFEYKESIEKLTMAGIFLEQALNNYLNNFLVEDNITVVAGQGTKAQHSWDEAYGYFTESKDFPTSGIDRFWGEYSNKVNKSLNTNDVIGCAFRKGRAALVANNKDEAKAQSIKIKAEWVKMSAANAVHYLNSAKTNYASPADRLHALTEAYGFISATQVTDTRLSALVTKIETEGLWELSETELTEMVNTIADTYQFGDLKFSL
jgi:hypothetical protein